MGRATVAETVSGPLVDGAGNVEPVVPVVVPDPVAVVGAVAVLGLVVVALVVLVVLACLLDEPHAEMSAAAVKTAAAVAGRPLRIG